jgi:molybdopterin converting factor small subunit
MSIKVHLYSSLRVHAGNHDLVEVRGTTVGECLDDLVSQYPDLSPLLFDDTGKLLKSVFVSINLESAYREQLAKSIKDNDNLYLILIVAGG